MSAPTVSSIPRIPRLPVERFISTFLRHETPVIITGALDDSPAMKQWTPEFLKTRYGDVQVSAVESDQGVFWHPQKGARRREVSLAEIVDRLQDNHSGVSLYLANLEVSQFPEIAGDVSPPPYVDAARLTQTSLWLGPAKTLTPLHFDDSHNIIAQIHGRKRVTLFSPDDTENLYPNRIPSRYPHNSQVGDVDHCDFERFPHVRNARALHADLSAGELLFIPIYWWHHVRSLEPAISVNYWWSVPAARRLNRHHARLLANVALTAPREIASALGRRYLGTG